MAHEKFKDAKAEFNYTPGNVREKRVNNLVAQGARKMIY